MQILILLLVIIILLLGGWWLVAVGFGLILAAIGALIAAVIWILQALWPLLLIALVVFVGLGIIGLFLEASGKTKPAQKNKSEPAPERSLPPISKAWAQRKADQKARSD